MLTNLLTKEMVCLDVENLATPEEVISYGGGLLVKSGNAEPAYVDKMLDAFHTIGPYIVMAPGLAMPHARPSGEVHKPCMSFMRLKNPVCFSHPINDPVSLVFTLGGVADDSHLILLQELGSFLSQEGVLDALREVQSYEELKSLLEKEGTV